MSSTSYSRNKYRCLLRPTHNVIVPNDNINEPKPGPEPRVYPYGYPGYGYSYPGYSSPGVYPGYGYSYPGYEYSYPGYGYGYPNYSSPGVYPGTRPFPYVANEKKTTAKPTPKNEMSHEYYSSSSSSSSDDDCFEYDPDRYYRRYAQVSPQRVFDEQNQKPFPIPKPTPNPPIHRPPRPKPPPQPIPPSEMNYPDNDEIQIKNKKQFAKPFARLLRKLTTPIQSDPISSNEQNDISLGDSNLLEFKNEVESAAIIDPSMCNPSNMNETKIYLKV